MEFNLSNLDGTCWCGATHQRCKSHVVECSVCEWSGGNTDPELPCRKCGEPCIRRPCNKWPPKGSPVCQAHGYNTRTKNATERNIAKAQLTEEVRRTRRQLGVTDIEPISNPYEALSMLAGEIFQVKSILLEKVEQLEDLRTRGGPGLPEQLDVLMSAYSEWTTKAERIIVAMSRLDLDARLATLHSAIDQEAAQRISGALEAALSSVALEPEQRSTILSAFGARLRGEDQPALPASK